MKNRTEEQKEKYIPLEEVKARRKLKLFWLLPLKRIVAGILLFMNVSVSFLALNQKTSEGILIFLPNAFILMDYLWKTRAV